MFPIIFLHNVCKLVSIEQFSVILFAIYKNPQAQVFILGTQLLILRYRVLTTRFLLTTDTVSGNGCLLDRLNFSG